MPKYVVGSSWSKGIHLQSELAEVYCWRDKKGTIQIKSLRLHRFHLTIDSLLFGTIEDDIEVARWLTILGDFFRCLAITLGNPLVLLAALAVDASRSFHQLPPIVFPIVLTVFCLLWGWSHWPFSRQAARRHHSAEHMIISLMRQGTKVNKSDFWQQDSYQPTCSTSLEAFVFIFGLTLGFWLYSHLGLMLTLCVLNLLAYGLIMLTVKTRNPALVWLSQLFQRFTLERPTESEAKIALRAAKKLLETEEVIRRERKTRSFEFSPLISYIFAMSQNGNSGD